MSETENKTIIEIKDPFSAEHAIKPKIKIVTIETLDTGGFKVQTITGNPAIDATAKQFCIDYNTVIRAISLAFERDY
jgi:hypothetical protein